MLGGSGLVIFQVSGSKIRGLYPEVWEAFQGCPPLFAQGNRTTQRQLP